MLEDEYKKIDTPEELLKFMNDNINYGFVDNKNGRIYQSEDADFEEANETIWRLATNTSLLKNKYGHCFDQVELERDWFEKHHYNFQTIFVWFEVTCQNYYAFHTYLIYEDKRRWYWFENADYYNKGIHEFNSYEAALKAQMIKHIDYNKKQCKLKTDDVYKIHLIKYDTPKEKCSFNEFIDHIVNNGVEITDKI